MVIVTDYDLEYAIDCVGMAIVNYSNEINKVSVKQRQETNDECFNYAKDKIKEFVFQVI
jgi:hypothetical protein